MNEHCKRCGIEAELLEHPYDPLLMICFDCRLGLIANWEEPKNPDKEKLIAFANAIFKFKNDSIPSLAFGSPAQPFLAKAEIGIDKIVKTLIKEAKEL